MVNKSLNASANAHYTTQLQHINTLKFCPTGIYKLSYLFTSFLADRTVICWVQN